MSNNKKLVMQAIHIMEQIQLETYNMGKINHVISLLKQIDFSDDGLTLDYSNQAVSYGALADAIKAEGLTDVLSVTDVIVKLKLNKKYTKILLNNNILSDEGLEFIVDYLVGYHSLEILDVSSNLISDIGLQSISKLLDLPNLKQIIIKDNYGPSNETLKICKNDERIIY